MKTLLPLLGLLGITLSLSAADGGVHGRVYGRVYGQDEKGENLGPLAGATIELKSESGGAAATAKTNEFGYYQIITLAPGAYRYKVAAAGFKVEDEQRGFAMPQDAREYVHDFLLSREPKPGAASGPAQTQVIQPAVHGRVYGQDEKGENLGPIAGAKVELLSGKGGTVVATTTASSPGGYYEIKNLPPADYAYRITATGFSTEDAGRGFTVPKATLEYVHDFLLSKPPPKRFKCDVPILVVKRISSGKDPANDARIPVPNAQVLLQPPANGPTPAGQPFVTDAKGKHRAKDLPEGNYTVAIDAPECEPFTGTLKVMCGDKDEEVIFELQPCNELLHGYVRDLLTDGWGPSGQAKGAAERAYQRATKAGGNGSNRIHYARALAQLSAGDYAAAQQSLATSVGKKRDDSTWDRACEARLWMQLCLHQPAQAVKEIRSLVKNHYGSRPPTPASKDTAQVCGIALGLIKGPWKDQVGAGEAALLESDLMSTLQGELQAECGKGRDHVAAEYGRLKTAEDAARTKLAAELTTKRDAEVARLTERQTVITRDVAGIDAEIQKLQATLNQFDEQLRVQITGFSQQRQMLAAQMAPLNARLQQINACMAQDQARYQAAQMQQQQQMQPQQQPSVTNVPGMRPGMMQPNAGAQAILVEMQQHQAEIQQIQNQAGVIQRQDAQMAAQIANLQNQFNANAGTAQASLNTKLRQREALAQEYDTLDRQRTAPFDPASFSTPEIDSLVDQGRRVKTYRDLPLENRREELLDQFDCGAAKNPQRPARPAGAPATIQEAAFPAPRSRPGTMLNASPAPSSRLPRAQAPSGLSPMPGMTPQRALPGPDPAAPPEMPPPSMLRPGIPPSSSVPGAQPPPANSTRPQAAAMGDAAQIMVSNNFDGAVRLFGVSPGAENEMFVRSLQPGEEAMLPAAVGQTFIIRAATGGKELLRHRMSKKLEVLKLGGPRPE